MTPIGVPWETVQSQVVITIELMLMLLVAQQTHDLMSLIRCWIERDIWLGPNPEESFGKLSSFSARVRSFEASVAQILGWRRKPYRRRFDFVTPLIAEPTCDWTEAILNEFGARAKEAPLTALFVHGIIVLSALAVAEVVSLGAVTGVGYAAYWTTGATIELYNIYQYTVAALILVSFSCLWTANQRFAA